MAFNPITLDQREEYPLGIHLDLMEDAQANLTIDQAISATHVHLFQPSLSETPNLGVKRSAIWARFTLRNTDQQARVLLLVFMYPPVDLVSLFIPTENGKFQRLDGGDSATQTNTAIRHRYPVFRLSVPRQSSQTYYLRIKTTGAMTIPLTLMSFSRFHEEDHQSQVIFGVLFGLVVGAVMYFSLMALKLRSPSVLWFVFYISLLGLMICAGKGFLQEHLGQRINPYNNLLHLIIIGLVYFSGAKFFRVFLQIGRYSPGMDRCILLLQWMGIFYIPMCIFENAITPLYSAILVGAGPIFSTTVAGIFWARDVPNAKYFFLGWLGGHTFSAVDLLRIYGMVPFTAVTPYVVPTAMCVSLAFFARALIQQASRYEQMAKQDMLTGLANRHAMGEFLSTEYNRNLRHGHPIALIMADVDYFKDYNDTYGHQAGDECLTKIAKMLKGVSRRGSEMAARYGGEEFALVLSDTGLDEAVTLAERIRAAVENLGIIHQASKVRPVVTISLGVACIIPTRDGDPLNLIAWADQALYRAKGGGRDQVVVAEAPGWGH
ncbi:MAG: GGDEF domain-containing protein [Desulfarculus sp.]|nr:GGDEF domain-containing protein [Desulfarculus sp.]